MDYAKHYWALIDRARNRQFFECSVERHHILPRCMGGGNERENLVRLKPEEHYIAHLLLAKMHPTNRKLAYACLGMRMMAGRKRAGPENKRYSWAERRRTDWLGKWRKFKHHPRKKKRYDAADLERMKKILAPREIYS